MKTMNKAAIILIALFISTFLEAQEKEFIFEEYFNDNSKGWIDRETDDYIFVIRDGIYYLESKDPDGRLSISANDILGAYKNFVIETRIKHTGGVENYSYGLIYGYLDVQNYYSF
jgi:hypothetical protein